ncbi:hypothetical protein [Streptomyces sp. NPDC058867]|uniref:hypothetical protein n=1 Tax=unclassified Streptomyces TaxID=2593676 RepID=UPI0036B9A1A7
MTGVTEEPAITETGADSSPVRLDAISEAVGRVWGMKLGTSTRKDIDGGTGELIRHLNHLVGQCLGVDESEDTLRLLRMVERHMAASNRPTVGTAAHDAYAYMRDSAVFASALVSVYQKANRAGEG